MATETLSIKYKAFEECERVRITLNGDRVGIFFEGDEELACILVGYGYDRDVQNEVFAVVNRNRRKDQLGLDSPPRTTEVHPVACSTEGHGCAQAASSLRGWCLLGFCVVCLCIGGAISWICGRVKL